MVAAAMGGVDKKGSDIWKQGVVHGGRRSEEGEVVRERICVED
jgi:hypothetical protein